MSNNNYTERAFWQEYWANHEVKPTETVFFKELIKDWPPGGKTFIEIGGFPGSFAAYFAREYKYDVTLLDYVVLPDVVRRVEEINRIPSGTIKTIESDFFSFESEKKYDIVFSAGFIEHFDDTKDVLQRHLELLKPGGKLLVTLPNFRGLNGLIQKIFDKDNYDIHNINCMDVEHLMSIADALQVDAAQVHYYGKPTLWLENIENRNAAIRTFVRLSAKIIRRIPFYKNRVLATYIIISGNKATAVDKKLSASKSTKTKV